MSYINKLRGLFKEKRTEIGTVINTDPVSPARYYVRTARGVILAQTLTNQTIKINDMVRLQDQVITNKTRAKTPRIYRV